MKITPLKIILVQASLMFAALSLHAQSTGENQNWCITDEILEEQFEADPQFKEQFERSMTIPQEEIEALRGSGGSRSEPFIIPVVFHVIHDNCRGNVSLEQLESAIDVLNEDFRRTNSDTGSTRSAFKDVAADAGIEFRLAKLDPDGNCTDGVVRINDPTRTYNVRNEPKEVSYWPSDQYLNVWLVNSIRGGSQGTVLGFAQFPGSGNLRTYGIVQRHDRTGRIGSAAGRDGRTFTHEVGHCLNLYHTFQSGCGDNCNSSGDRVCDTPPSSNSTFACNPNQNTCSNDTQGPSPFTQDMPDQFENYMSYDPCQNMFSEGQRIRMVHALNNYPHLINLTSHQNLVATGVIDHQQNYVCKADFKIEGFEFCQDNIIQICRGDHLKFKDQSLYNPVSYNWEFEGGNPAVSAYHEPTIIYNQSGIYKVALSVSGSGSETAGVTKENHVMVLPQSGKGVPVKESFEFEGSPLHRFWLPQQFESGYGWIHNDRESYTGDKSMRVPNFDVSGGSAILKSPNYKLDRINSPEFVFYTAYAQIDNSVDRLKLEFSADCGKTWKTQAIITGAQLASAPEMSSPIFGLSPNNWKEHRFVIQNEFLKDQFQFRFTFTGAGGNDIYLDDIMITGTPANNVPRLTSPENNSNPVPLAPVLDWDPASGSLYEVHLDKTPDFNSPDLQTKTISIGNNFSNTSDTRWELGELGEYETYYWRVRTITAASQENPWSVVWSFTTGDITTDVRERQREEVQISLYPNPARDELYIRTDAEVESILIFNTTGERVLQSPLRSRDVNRINTSQLPAGFYIARIKMLNGTSEIRRVVITK